MLLAREETFGPVAPLFGFKIEAEAIQMANDTEFGLAAYFYARDMGRVQRVSEALEYGIVGVNTGIISTEVAERPKPAATNHRAGIVSVEFNPAIERHSNLRTPEVSRGRRTLVKPSRRRPVKALSDIGVWPRMERGRPLRVAHASGALSASHRSPSATFARTEEGKEAHDSIVSRT